MLGYLKPGAYHQALCEKLASRLSYKEFVDIWNGLLSANEDMTALVEWLKPIHRLVLGSNTDPIHFAYSVQQFPVLGNFESFFLSYEMGLVKPVAAFFHHILDSLDVQATDCVFADDRAENVESARKIGITAIQFEDAHQLQLDLKGIL